MSNITDAENAIRTALEQANDEEATSITHAMIAVSLATLALVEQQHVANMQTERQALRNRAIGRYDDAARQHLDDAADLDVMIRKALGL